MMAQGYKDTILEKDLWDLNDDIESKACSAAFSAEWRREIRKKEPSLVLAFYRAFGFTFTIAGVMKLIQDLIAFIK